MGPPGTTATRSTRPWPRCGGKPSSSPPRSARRCSPCCASTIPRSPGTRSTSTASRCSPPPSWLRCCGPCQPTWTRLDRKSTRLNSSHVKISYAVFCLKKKKDHEPRVRFAKKEAEHCQGPDTEAQHERREHQAEQDSVERRGERQRHRPPSFFF